MLPHGGLHPIYWLNSGRHPSAAPKRTRETSAANGKLLVASPPWSLARQMRLDFFRHPAWHPNLLRHRALTGTTCLGIIRAQCVGLVVMASLTAPDTTLTVKGKSSGMRDGRIRFWARICFGD